MFLTHFDASKFISCSKADTNFPCFFVFFFFPETKLSPCFHITAFKFLYFPVFVGNVPKIYGPRKSAPRNYFSCAVSGGLFSESKTGPRWDWVSNHNAHGHYNDNTLKKEIDLFEILLRFSRYVVF